MNMGKRIFFLIIIFVLGFPVYENKTWANQTSVTAMKATEGLITYQKQYKGQPYIELEGNSNAIKSINKTLKLHAVRAAASNKYNVNEYPYGTYETSVKVLYVTGDLISIVHEDYSYSGGVHGLSATISYNFNYKTAQQFNFFNVVNPNKQLSSVRSYISERLKARYNAGENLFEDAAETFELTKDTSFYFYKDGIVIVFDPYMVGPYAEGAIKVQVPYSVFKSK
ncbi:DUF3298 domain-containing protein [Paenibacillus sp. WLX1005]|uniref:DUF3298 and DUF4163 domain-containing protein n=1 Tax=Paenibacillus sp. WLX1005 TaxID=3243766 RepID=UPI003983E090